MARQLEMDVTLCRLFAANTTFHLVWEFTDLGQATATVPVTHIRAVMLGTCDNHALNIFNSSLIWLIHVSCRSLLQTCSANSMPKPGRMCAPAGGMTKALLCSCGDTPECSGSSQWRPALLLYARCEERRSYSRWISPAPAWIQGSEQTESQTMLPTQGTQGEPG